MVDSIHHKMEYGIPTNPEVEKLKIDAMGERAETWLVESGVEY